MGDGNRGNVRLPRPWILLKSSGRAKFTLIVCESAKEDVLKIEKIDLVRRAKHHVRKRFGSFILCFSHSMGHELVGNRISHASANHGWNGSRMGQYHEFQSANNIHRFSFWFLFQYSPQLFTTFSQVQTPTDSLQSVSEANRC